MPNATARYAYRTETAVPDTRREIEQTLTRYHTADYGISTSQTTGEIRVVFTLHARPVMVRARLPRLTDPEIQNDKWGHSRPIPARQAALAAETRRVWRVLLLQLKARLEIAHADAQAFHREFLAETILPDGRTVGDTIAFEVEARMQGLTTAPLHLPAGHSDGA